MSIGWSSKGFPALQTGHEVARIGWNVLDGSALVPLLTIRESALKGKIETMAAYCRREGVELAPHGKTTMAPEIFSMQLEAGAWGMTAATAWQVGAMRAMGCRRILLANVLVDPAGVALVAQELANDPEFELYCYVDSVDGLRVMVEEMEKCKWPRPLPVLLELGQERGRTGMRSVAAALALAAEIVQTHHVELAGIAGFEGLIKGDETHSVTDGVRAFLRELRRLVEEADRLGYFAEREEVIVSAGGSSYFDLVVDALVGLELSVPVRRIIRSGGYVTHDIKMYEDTSPLALRRSPNEPLRLRPAMELWATVWSRPEPELVIAGFGKRDAGHDYGLPQPLRLHRRGTGEVHSLADDHVVTDLNDQHAFLRVPAQAEIGPGDVIVCGISHPCTSFERWRSIPLIDDDHLVIDSVETYF